MPSKVNINFHISYGWPLQNTPGRLRTPSLLRRPLRVRHARVDHRVEDVRQELTQ